MTLCLLTDSDCQLCDHGKTVLADLTAEGLLSWREVSAESEEGQRLAAVAPPLRPVLFWPDGRVAAYGRLSARGLRKRLGRAAQAGAQLS